jgi:hypothetical protein
MSGSATLHGYDVIVAELEAALEQFYAIEEVLKE